MNTIEELHTVALAEERTLLAAERTFSAWIRTALAAMAGGLAILRLITFKTELHRLIAHIMGEMLIVWALLLLIVAAMEYKKTVAQLQYTKNFKSSSIGFILIVVPLWIISLLLIWVTVP
ncbi:DUF202 domain-containing protein [Candidatus Dependentiae bacterium]|nr:DUF202 domain-containing protein [Candidatus Dependentiae bacterium]